MKIFGAIMLSVLACMSVLALAEGEGDGKGPCRQDVQRFCAQATGAGRTMDCLIERQKDISDTCYDALKARLAGGQGNAGGQANAGGQGGACQSDAAQFCRGVQPGGGRIVDCLISHQQDISEACYQALKKQVSNGEGGGDGGFQSAGVSSAARTPPAPVYRSRQPDGRIVYSDSRPMASMLQRTVPLDRVIVAQPPR